MSHPLMSRLGGQVTVRRDSPGGTLGVAIDRWGGEVTVGAVTPDGPVDREGTLVQGDVVCGVDGVACDSIEEVTALVLEPTIDVTLHICRRPVVPIIESELTMQMGQVPSVWMVIMMTLLLLMHDGDADGAEVPSV